MKTEHRNRWNRLCGLGYLALIGCMILTASLAAGAEDLSAWQKRMPIAFSGYTPSGGGETLTNFPVLVILSNTAAGVGFNYTDFCSPPYGDLRFAAGDKTTPLDFEVESWDTNGLSHVWVRVPELTTNATIYAYWGQSGVSVPACTTNGGVWTNGFASVWHMTQSDAKDSSPNARNGSVAGGTVASVTGVVSGASSFSTGYIVAVSPVQTSGNTVSLWFNANSVASGQKGIFTTGSSATEGSPHMLLVNNNASLQTYRGSYGPIATIAAKTWYYLTLVHSDTQELIYLNGAYAGKRTWGTAGNNANLYIGSGYQANFQGQIDEFRVSTVQRSPDWIWASYVAMASNDIFAVYGTPESQDLPGVGGSGLATNVTSSDAWLNGALSSTGTSDTAVFAYWGLTDGGLDASAWANTNSWDAPQALGAFTTQATGLSVDSTYYYRFAASNAAGWAWMPEASVFITGDVWVGKTTDASEIDAIPGAFTVHRTAGATNEALIVTYTVGGTATPGTDYAALSGTVTIPKGEVSATIEVLPIFEYVKEETETVVVTLASGPYRTGALSNATVEIMDYGARADENLFLWQKRMPLAFSGYTPPGGDETLTNFPVLVILSNTTAGAGFAYSDFQSPPYGDLRFTLDDKQTQLDFEVASWDTNGPSYVWVRVPELTDNLTIYALWGQNGIGAPPHCTTDGAVWSEGFTGVWHLEETDGITARDAIGNRYPGTLTGATASMGATGQVGRAYRFGGNTGYVATDLTNGPTVTVSAWGSLTSAGERMLWCRATFTPDLFFSSGNIYLNAADGTGNPFCAQPTGVAQLHHYVTVIEAGRPKASLYIDGQLASTNANYKSPAGNLFRISSGCGYDWHGIIDEFSVAGVVRSSNWIWASYMTMASNDLFAVTGTPEWGGFPVVNQRAWVTHVTPNSAWLSGTLMSTGFSETAVFAYWGPTDGGTDVSAWANTNTWAAPQMPGDFTTQATGLTPDSTYCCRFAASNAAGWAWTPQASVFITGEVWIENTSDALEDGPTPGTFTVHRASAATNEALIVTYTVGGTATPGVDYRALSGTITIPKGEQIAVIEVMPIYDHFVEGTETVELMLVPGPYAIGSSSNATVNIEDYGLVTRTWSGGGANELASTAANWVEGAVPEAGDRIVLANESAGALTWDLDVSLHSWRQDGYTSTVTVLTVYPEHGTFTNFVILNDCEIQSGFLTHSQNSSVQKYRLCLTVGGKLTIGTEGSVHADVRGYQGSGPGAAEGAAYGGCGAHGLAGMSRCYGSITDPLDLGSGGRNATHGGGALLLWVAGELRNDGNCSSDGEAISFGSGSGGSVWIFAGSLTGSGRFSAKGGAGSTYRVAGGGRMAFILTDLDADFSAFTGTMTAYSGAGHGYAGTVYRETVANGTGHGELIVDNLNGYADNTFPYPGVYVYGRTATELNFYEPVSYAFSRIVLTNKAVLFVGSDDTLDLRETELVGGGRLTTGIRVGGGTLLTPSVFTWSNLFFCVTEPNAVFSGNSTWIVASNTELRLDQPLVMTNGNSLVVQPGGLLTHTANLAGNTESFKLDLTLDGSLIVEGGGLVDVTGRGFPVNYGPGAALSGYAGASYGGLGVGGLSCYGSLVAPTNLGSGGRSSGAGGGAIRLAVAGVVSNSGGILANATTVTANTGSGGSIFITAGALDGAGPIQANSATNVTGTNPGGGGRVAVAVTNTGERVADYAGTITAYGGRKPAAISGGAGTVYLRDPGQGLTEGTLIVDNDNLTGMETEINATVTDTAVGNVFIRRAGSLLLDTDQTLPVSGIWSNEASFRGLTDSTVIFDGVAGSTSTIYGSTIFMRLICTNADYTLAFEAESTNAVAAYGRLILRGDEDSNLILRSTASGTPWYLNADPLAEQDIAHVDVSDSNAADGAEIVAKNSVGEDQANVNWRFPPVAPGDTMIWTGSTDTRWALASNWDLGRAPVETDVVVIPGGCPNYPVFDTARTMSGLWVQAGGSIVLNDTDLTVTSDARIAGVLAASGSETLTFRGDVDFTGGTFTPASATVVLSGDVTQSVNLAGLTFYKVRVDNSAAAVTLSGGFTATELRCEVSNGTGDLRFEAGKTVSLRDLVLRGAVGTTNLMLNSTTPEFKWNLAVSRHRSVSGVAAHDSDASAGLPIPAVASEDGGGNVNWTFVAPVRWLGTSGNNFHTAANWNPAVVPDVTTRVVVESANPMTMTGAVTVLDLTVGGGTGAAAVTVNALLTVVENINVLSNGTLAINQPCVVSNGVYVLAGGTLTHSGNIDAEVNKLDVSVWGDVEIDMGGTVNANGKGYAPGKGPGTAGSGGSSYGGRGAAFNTSPPGLCYGSLVAPTNLGSGGNFSAGGGVILLKASGAIHNDGLVCADGGPAQHYQGSGGSVFLTAGVLTGLGTIRANGGDMTSGGYAAAAGGGRIALVVTNAGADFSTYTGFVQALSTVLVPAGVDAKSAGAGTVYHQTAADQPGRGTVTVDNDNFTSSGCTDMPPYTNYAPGEVYRAVFHVAHAAQLRLTTNVTVGDIWLETANAVLNLDGRTLTVKAREHDLGGSVVAGGSEEDPGKIIWTGLPPGVLIIVK